MKRIIGNFMAMFCVAILCLGIASCSKDDSKETSVKEQLIGIWQNKLDNVPSSEFDYIELKSDGTFLCDLHPHYTEKNTLENYHNHNGIWIYDEKEHTLAMTRSDGYWTYTFKIVMSDDGNTWSGYYTRKSGETVTIFYTRLKGEYVIVKK